MSTKTTFKRIALVAVAALGLGMLSVAPSSAAPRAAYTSMYDTTNGVAIVGAQATVTFTLETSTTNTFSWSGVGTVNYAQAATGVAGDGYGVGTATFPLYSSGTRGANDTNISGGSASGTRYYAAPASGTTVVVTNSAAGGTVTFGLSSTTAGAQTITLNHVDSSGVPGTAVSKSVTWAAGSYTPNAGYSSSYIGSSAATTAFSVAATANSTIYASKTVGSQAALISTTLKSDVNAALNNQSITYAITSGPGTLTAVTDGSLITTSSTVAGRSVTDLDLSGNTASVGVVSDGTAGTTVITVTSGTTTIATHTMYFVGTVATYTPSVLKNTLRVGSNVGATYTVGSSDYVVRVKAVDSNGNRVVDGSTVYASSSNPLVAAIATSATTTSGYAYFDVTGVIAGEGVKFTFRDASTAALSTVTAESTAVNVTSSSIASLAMKFDKTSYEPGEKMTLTITALNSAGKPVADYGTAATGDNLYTGVFLAAGTSNVALNGFSMGTSLETYDGVAEYTMYAPLIAGTVTVTSGTMVWSTTAAQYGSKLTATAAVASTAANPTLDAAQAANDAAAEATDAANAATDAANAAAEAADAATAAAQDAADAVAALSAQVATLISGLKAQLTALTNLVIKIQKKVKA
jgi:hypothetical protein